MIVSYVVHLCYNFFFLDDSWMAHFYCNSDSCMVCFMRHYFSLQKRFQGIIISTVRTIFENWVWKIMLLSFAYIKTEFRDPWMLLSCACKHPKLMSLPDQKWYINGLHLNGWVVCKSNMTLWHRFTPQKTLATTELRQDWLVFTAAMEAQPRTTTKLLHDVIITKQFFFLLPLYTLWVTSTSIIIALWLKADFFLRAALHTKTVQA